MNRHISYKSVILMLSLMMCIGAYANANGGIDSWNFYVTDRLGSTRVVVDKQNNVKETINYYPFGSEMTMTPPAQISSNPNWHPIRFTGKELMRQNSLNVYDYGARNYDAILARWDRIDPLCEKYYHISPYVYCAGNPIKFIDSYGERINRWRVTADSNGKEVHSPNITTVRNVTLLHEEVTASMMARILFFRRTWKKGPSSLRKAAGKE